MAITGDFHMATDTSAARVLVIFGSPAADALPMNPFLLRVRGLPELPSDQLSRACTDNSAGPFTRTSATSGAPAHAVPPGASFIDHRRERWVARAGAGAPRAAPDEGDPWPGDCVRLVGGGARPPLSALIDFIDAHRGQFGSSRSARSCASRTCMWSQAPTGPPPHLGRCRPHRGLSGTPWCPSGSATVHGDRDLGRGLYSVLKVDAQLVQGKGVGGCRRRAGRSSGSCAQSACGAPAAAARRPPCSYPFGSAGWLCDVGA